MGTLCSTWNVEMGICTLEWVCRSFSLVIPIGKSNSLVGSAVDALGFVRPFRARADDGRGVVIDRRVVGAHSCGFGEICAIARCVRYHRPNEVDDVVCASRFVVRDLEEERRHDLPYSSEVGV